MRTRLAQPSDATAVARIYNEGIEDRVATFETALRTPEWIASWFDGRHPVVVVEDRGAVVGFAAARPYSSRECYRGIAEASVYIARGFRGRGAGRLALQGLIAAAEEAGFWKLLSRIFVENEASRNLVRSAGFREVGVYEKHGCLDGIWKDCLIVERLIPRNLTESMI